MRNIDKTKILSSQYKKWEEEFAKRHQKHDDYNSSQNIYYIDVVMNLLHVQMGLCAYTERRLCKLDLLDEKNWMSGKYSNRHPEIFGQLDHFNPKLKKENGWLWDNFFFIDTDINTKVKGKMDVDTILKPDTKEYNVEKLMEYDQESHLFIPQSDLDDKMQARIKNMILKLGINFDAVVDARKEYLEDKLAQKRFGFDVTINQYPTAFQMCIKS